MLKKTLTFTTLDGEEVTEEVYFHLSEAEIIKLQMSKKGGVHAYVNQILAEEDGQKIIDFFEDIIRMSIGRRSADGRKFVKNDEIADDFMNSMGYSDFFMELVTNEKIAASFVTSLLPKERMDAITKKMELVENAGEGTDEEKPDYMKEGRNPTSQELVAMSTDEAQVALAWMKKRSDG